VRRREEIEMVKVSMEVRKGASRFAVAVSAENLQRAVSIVQGHYPSSDCRVLSPAGAEDFVAAYSARAKMGERPAGMAA
jgi:hypothetical protein